jgi:hypothetical protein
MAARASVIWVSWRKVPAGPVKVPIYALAVVPPHAEPVCQISQRQQARRRERAPCRRDHHERVRRRHVGPSRWQREQLPGVVVQVDPVLTPVLPVGDELEVPAMQRVQRVRHPDTSVPIARIGCS